MRSQSREPSEKKTQHSEGLGDLGEPSMLFMYFVSRLFLKRIYSGIKHISRQKVRGGNKCSQGCEPLNKRHPSSPGKVSAPSGCILGPRGARTLDGTQ